MGSTLRCLGVGVLCSLLVAGCATRVARQETSETGYTENASYVTKIDLPAIVYVGKWQSDAGDIELLRYPRYVDTGGKIEVIRAGTTILVLNVTRDEDPDLGALVRVFAKITSGPYRGESANLYGISIREKRPDGRSGLLKRDPSILDAVN